MESFDILTGDQDWSIWVLTDLKLTNHTGPVEALQSWSG